ncbi:MULTISPECIES: hypothetical protein [unclassified Bradyrhizobium]|uniref:hypothetical protein n=1 Tax=unclassified Bradyrhizobium TaxID=2631580 RepID=UPI0028E76E53|nr:MULTISPECIES: hypothetical protein [unclassified Bradyrhizobium]
MRFRNRGAGLDNKLKRFDSEMDVLAALLHGRRREEPTKRELREQIAQAVRNTAALPINGGN